MSSIESCDVPSWPKPSTMIQLNRRCIVLTDFKLNTLNPATFCGGSKGRPTDSPKSLSLHFFGDRESQNSCSILVKQHDPQDSIISVPFREYPRSEPLIQRQFSQPFDIISFSSRIVNQLLYSFQTLLIPKIQWWALNPLQVYQTITVAFAHARRCLVFVAYLVQLLLGDVLVSWRLQPSASQNLWIVHSMIVIHRC